VHETLDIGGAKEHPGWSSRDLLTLSAWVYTISISLDTLMLAIRLAVKLRSVVGKSGVHTGRQLTLTFWGGVTAPIPMKLIYNECLHTPPSDKLSSSAIIIRERHFCR